MLGRQGVESRRCVIGRAVVDEDRLELAGREGLSEQGLDAPVDVSSGIVDGDDDADLDRPALTGNPRIRHGRILARWCGQKAEAAPEGAASMLSR